MRLLKRTPFSPPIRVDLRSGRAIQQLPTNNIFGVKHPKKTAGFFGPHRDLPSAGKFLGSKNEPRNPTLRRPCVQPGKIRPTDDITRAEVNQCFVAGAAVELPSWGFLAECRLRLQPAGRSGHFWEVDRKSDYKILRLRAGEPMFAPIVIRGPTSRQCFVSPLVLRFSALQGAFYTITCGRALSVKYSPGSSACRVSGITTISGF